MTHPIRRRIIESLQDNNLSFTELLQTVDEANHGRFGFHLRALQEFVKLEPSTKKYHLTNRGTLLAHVIQNFRSTSSRREIHKEYAENLVSRDHALGLYADEKFKRKMLHPFLKAGLLAGEAVLYLAPEHKLDSEIKEIQGYGIDLENLRKEAFTIMSAYEWYLEKGKAQDKTIIANWLELIKEKKNAGFSGIHAIGEMNVFLDYAKKALLKYEKSLGKKLPRGLCALCLYNTEKLDSDLFPQLINCHSHLISKDIVGQT